MIGKPSSRCFEPNVENIIEVLDHVYELDGGAELAMKIGIYLGRLQYIWDNRIQFKFSEPIDYAH